MYAKGMTTSDIAVHIQDICGAEVSDLSLIHIFSPAISEVKSILENSSNSMPLWDGFLSADRTTSHKNALQALVSKTMTPEEFVDDMEAFLK